MLTYLIILLDETSVSFCHQKAERKEPRLVNIDVLRSGIVWAMKENLNIQFVYPHYCLPGEYRDVIDSIDHIKIGPVACGEKLDVVVSDGWQDKVPDGSTCIIQTSRKQLVGNLAVVTEWLERLVRLNIVLTDVETFTDSDIDNYRQMLDSLVDNIVELYQKGITPQLNLLTDRLVLNQMNNCGAGDTCVTLAPNGKFYICPEFFHEDELQSVGDLTTGIAVPNRQLLQLSNAPICRVCDAWQCRRCIWMNERLTGDMNTPSHQQCVVSHLERNASRRLQQLLNKKNITVRGSKEIPKIDYLDPFSIATRWK